MFAIIATARLFCAAAHAYRPDQNENFLLGTDPTRLPPASLEAVSAFFQVPARCAVQVVFDVDLRGAGIFMRLDAAEHDEGPPDDEADGLPEADALNEIYVRPGRLAVLRLLMVLAGRVTAFHDVFGDHVSY